MITGRKPPLQRLVGAAAAVGRRRRTCELTTVDAGDGSLRTVALREFNECLDSWLVVAEQPGSTGWLHNVLSNPDQVWLRLRNGAAMRVDPESVADDEHRDVWRRIASEAPDVAQRQARHGLQLPILRMVQVEPA